MNFFQTQEYLAIFARHFSQDKDIVDGIWEKQADKLVLLGMKPVLGGEEVTDYGQTDIRILPPGHPSIQLDYIREDSATYLRFKDRAQKQEVSPYIDLPSSWEEYLNGLERKQRKELKRKINRLESTNRFYQCTPATVREDFEDFIRLHRLSDPKKHKFMSEPMKAFFWDVKAARIPGWQQHICFLKLDNRPVAGLMTFESETEVWAYNSGYDPAYSHLSVGLLIQSYKIKKAIEAGKDKFDFLRGAERYKYDLGAKDLQLYQIQLD